MAGVLLAHQPTGEKGKARLHKEYKVPCDESPIEVGRNPNVPDRVGELYRKRLFGCLFLVLLVLLFLFRIVRGLRIGRLGNNKGIAGPINGICLPPVATPAGSG